MSLPNPEPSGKGPWIAGTVLVTLAVSGYFMGLQQTRSHLGPAGELKSIPESSAYEAGASNAVPGIVSYAQVDRKKIGPNAGFSSDMRLLARAVVLLTTLTNVTDAERGAALRQREARRAFDGAPPVVPHPINQDSSAACLACHGPGLAIKDRVASKISHAHYGNCTQCHVPAQSGLGLTTDPALLAALADNVFSGAVAPAKGVRASVGAPPTIPHSTLLRSDCNSCHGPAGLFGLRTPHPDRQSCVQCHVPNAELDQRKLLGSITP